MEPPKTLKVEIPEIRASVLKREDDERKGAGAGLLSKLGLGGGSSGGAGGLAAGGGLLAGKAGIVALIVAGSSVAAGVGLLTLSNNGGGVLHPSGVFAKADGSAPSDSAQAASNPAASPEGGVSSSLDNFHQANRGAVPDPYAPAAQQPEKVNDAAGPAQVAGSPSAAPDNSTTQSPGTTPPTAGARPKMVKGQGFGGSSSSGSGSGASGGGLVAAGERPGATANFAHSAPGGTSALRAERGLAGAQRRSAISNGFNGASGQLLAHSNTLRSNLGSGMVSSQGSGAVMDGALAAGSIGGQGSQISGWGAGTGGKGIDSSPGASVSQNLRQVSPPPPPVDNKGKNQTSYQKQIMMAIGAMLGAMALLYFSGMYADKAKVSGITPVEKAADLHIARNLAGLATALAAVATGIGLWLMNQQGQMMQGLMLTGIGGILTFSAGKAWIQGMSSAKQADAQVSADAKASADAMHAKLVDGSINTTSGTFQATPPGANAPSTYDIQYAGGSGAGAPAPSAPAASSNLAPAKLVPTASQSPTFIPPSF